ncbi:uncharacterized protein PG998_002037 [Apiospora kogelbergensis]|uniref:uncharacterized protein n=1 Tax=Apiospora kogelbergensis TaxID=1337665 RepID=UPI00312FBF05
MRLSQRQQWPLPTSLVALLLTFTLTTASPYPKDELRDLGYGYIMERACDSYCGADNQYCCSAGQQCYTSAGIAGCAATAANGGSTWSTYVPGATDAAGAGVGGADCVPKAGTGQIACGPICCTNQQYCHHSGQCMPNGPAGWVTTTAVGTTVGVVTTQYSAPYRVTSGSTVYESTGTAASQTAEPTSDEGAVTTTNNSLSGGAIAGIVIGTIAGLILLLLLCFFCIARGLWHTLFGGKKKDRRSERVEVIEEHYSRHGGSAAAAGRPAHRTWFGGGGGRPATVTSRREKEKKSSGAGWLATAGGAALLLLGLRRGDKKEEEKMRKPPRSDFGSSYYTDSYTASSPTLVLTAGRAGLDTPGERGHLTPACRGIRDALKLVAFPRTL